jgi:hypothetical protein
MEGDRAAAHLRSIIYSDPGNPNGLSVTDRIRQYYITAMEAGCVGDRLSELFDSLLRKNETPLTKIFYGPVTLPHAVEPVGA